MRTYVMAIAVLILIGGCKGDDKKSESGPAPAPKVHGSQSEPAPGPAPAPKAAEPEPAPEPEPSASDDPSREPATVDPDPEAKSDPEAIIDRAIEAAGGLDALTSKFAAFTVASRGLYLGSPYEMTTVWKAPNLMYMTIDDGGMKMGYTGTDCWNAMDGIVMDCFPQEAKAVPAQLYVTNLEGLYVMKEAGFGFEALGPGEVNSKATTGVLVTHPDAPIPVKLQFYDDTGLLARSEYAGSFGGVEGPLTHDILTYKEVDGIQVQRKTLLRASEKLYIEDMLVEVTWGADEALFKRPPQRAAGEPTVRIMKAFTAAYVVHEGPYEQLSTTVGGLATWVTTSGLDVMGPPSFVYLTNPGQVEDPKQYRTEIRIPVTSSRNLTVQHEVYALKPIEETLVAAQFEIGPYEASSKAFDSLGKWCSTSGYAIAGPPMMIGYSDPTTTAPSDLLNEFLFPVRKSE